MTKDEFLKELGRHGYTVDKSNKAAIVAIFDHINSEPTKGICLVGKVGTGKSFFMRLLERYVVKYHPRLKWRTLTTRDIAYNLRTQDYKFLDDINSGHMYIDEIMKHQAMNYYGNEIDPVAMVLYERYDAQVIGKRLTHITSNVPLSELEYGDRLQSRFKEMFKEFVFLGTDRRK